MPKKYTRKHFQKDLKKLANLIENYNSTSYMKGGAKKLDKNGNPIEYGTFRVVQEDGQSVSFGTYRINKNQPVGPEKAASKAARVICRRVRANGSDHRVCHGKTLMIQEKTGFIASQYDYWILRKPKTNRAPRWNVLYNVFGFGFKNFKYKEGANENIDYRDK